MLSQRSRRRGRLKAPNIPVLLDNSVPSSPLPHEVAGVINTMAGISAASADIIRRNEEGKSCLPTATLCRASALSESLWEEVLLLPLSTIQRLQKSLTIYELILVDIQQILNSNDPLEISDDTIDRRLDDFMLQFQEVLDLLKATTSPPTSTHFFQNSHHIFISGGSFNSTSNPVVHVHDPVVREQSHKILQMIYIQSGVLFY